jgi:hypothetical protein
MNCRDCEFRVLCKKMLFFHVLSFIPLAVRCCDLEFFNGNSSIENGGLFLKWNVSNDFIDLFVSAKNLDSDNAWFAFGLSEAGGMLGSDILTIEIKSSSAIVVDRYVPWTGAPLDQSPLPYPVEDESQDWMLTCYSNDRSLARATVRRKLITKDPQDRPIVPGIIPVIYAWGNGSLGYHGSNRGSIGITFISDTPNGNNGAYDFQPPADSDDNFEVGFTPGFSSRPITTQYVCQAYDIGSELRQIVAVEQVYHDTLYGQYVHHVLIHACGSDRDALLDLNIREDIALPCQSTDMNAHGNSPGGTRVCTSILYASAVGGSPFVLPSVAGIEIGSDVRYIVVEAHIDNPSHVEGALITTIAKFHTTTSLRQYKAGAMVIGDPAINLPVIEGGHDFVHYETTCTSSCTQRFVSDRHVFSSFLHMHQVGRKIWTSLLKFDSEKNLVSKFTYDFKEYWNFGFQEGVDVDILISPGDQISTHCIFDTTKSGPVQFGSDSSDEMCMSFLFFYPYQPSDIYFCGYFTSDRSLCGRSIIAESNPQPDGDVDLPNTLFMSYTDDGEGDDGNGEGDDGNGEGDDGNGEADDGNGEGDDGQGGGDSNLNTNNAKSTKQSVSGVVIICVACACVFLLIAAILVVYKKRPSVNIFRRVPLSVLEDKPPPSDEL